MKYGYDIGGAEFSFDPEHYSIVDIDKPLRLTYDGEPFRADIEADWFRRDLNDRNWTEGLEPRPLLYVGKVLRYLNERRLSELAEEFDRITVTGGTITIFDRMDVIDQVITNLQITYGYRVVETEEINPADPFDPESQSEFQVVLVKI